jgi:hypothetical protein
LAEQHVVRLALPEFDAIQRVMARRGCSGRRGDGCFEPIQPLPELADLAEQKLV